MTAQDGIHGFHIGTEYAVAYHYDNAGTSGQLTGTGRFKRITGPGLDGTYGAVYARLVENGVNTSDLVEYTYFKSSSDATLATIHRKYDGNRDLVDFVENLAGSTTVSRYDYTNDSLSRRTSVENSGTAFAATAFNLWGYNPKSELEASRRRDRGTPYLLDRRDPRDAPWERDLRSLKHVWCPPNWRNWRIGKTGSTLDIWAGVETAKHAK